MPETQPTTTQTTITTEFDRLPISEKFVSLVQTQAMLASNLLVNFLIRGIRQVTKPSGQA